MSNLTTRLKLYLYLKKKSTIISNDFQIVHNNFSIMDLLLLPFYQNKKPNYAMTRDKFICRFYQKFFATDEQILCQNNLYYSILVSILDMNKNHLPLPMLKQISDHSLDHNVTIKEFNNNNNNNNNKSLTNIALLKNISKPNYYFDIHLKNIKPLNSDFLPYLNTQNFMKTYYPDIYKDYIQNKNDSDYAKYIINMTLHFALLQQILATSEIHLLYNLEFSNNAFGINNHYLDNETNKIDIDLRKRNRSDDDDDDDDEVLKRKNNTLKRVKPINDIVLEQQQQQQQHDDDDESKFRLTNLENKNKRLRDEEDDDERGGGGGEKNVYKKYKGYNQEKNKKGIYDKSKIINNHNQYHYVEETSYPYNYPSIPSPSPSTSDYSSSSPPPPPPLPSLDQQFVQQQQQQQQQQQNVTNILKSRDYPSNIYYQHPQYRQ